MAKKKYIIPDELWALRTKSSALNALRDQYIILRFFGYRMARKAAIEATAVMIEFWDGVRELFPELRGKYLKVIDGKEVVVVDGNGQEKP